MCSLLGSGNSFVQLCGVAPVATKWTTVKNRARVEMRYFPYSYRSAICSAGLLSVICFLYLRSTNMDSESNDLSHELLDSRDAARQPAFSDELQANILDFYEVPEHDALHINWRHAVNSRKKLASALADETVHMLECDVILSAEDSVPICAHPPQTQSDLTVLSLLETLLAAGTKKGLKLDFKQFEAVRATLSIIGSRRFRNELRVPIWFNADVLSGPGGLLTPHIDARKFLQECLSTFRWATFSLGWTTGDGSRANSK